LRGLALCGLVSLAGFALWTIVPQFIYGGFGQGSRAIVQAITFEEKTGLRLVRVAVTAGGGMIDLRLKVLDPDKAMIVHERSNPPTVIDEATGQAINRPWMEHSRGHHLHHDATYYQLLLNPGRVIKRGSHVTLVVGEVKLQHVTVQ
jgi:hypothetical protein